MGKYLLVDDNEAFAENVAEILRDEGHEVFASSSGEEALRRVRAERYDVLITDMRMPEMGGAALVHQLRRIDPDIPVIAVTAYSGDEDLKVARAEGLLAINAWAEKNINREMHDVIMDDILYRRNREVIRYMGKALERYDTVVIPWGAMHMKEIEGEVLKRGFVLREERERVSMDFLKMLLGRE